MTDLLKIEPQIISIAMFSHSQKTVYLTSQFVHYSLALLRRNKVFIKIKVCLNGIYGLISGDKKTTISQED